MGTSERWVVRPEGSNWGDFGPDDQLGRINLLTPEKVLQGVAEVKEGLAFCLSLPLDVPGGNVLNPRRHPPRLQSSVRDGLPNYHYPVGRELPGATDLVCDDMVTLFTQYSTQWDGLCHAGAMFDADGDGEPEMRYYNGYRGGSGEAADIPGPETPALEGIHSRDGTHAPVLGIEGMAASGVQGRGVMLDLHYHFGEARRFVGLEDLKSVMAADGVTVEPGDMLCLHTGYAELLLAMEGHPDPDRIHDLCCVLDGRDQGLLDWITESGIAVLIADNYAVEGLPAREHPVPCASMPLHHHCLFKLGIHLGELWHLTPLARWLRDHGRSRFLLTAPPLRLPGAVGSPATPVATV